MGTLSEEMHRLADRMEAHVRSLEEEIEASAPDCKITSTTLVVCGDEVNIRYGFDGWVWDGEPPSIDLGAAVREFVKDIAGGDDTTSVADHKAAHALAEAFERYASSLRRAVKP